MRELFLGTGIAHSILLFAVVIMLGLWLGRFKIKGITIGSTWILFVGILLSHFGLRSDPVVLSFMKDFGLILFVFSIGLSVGPGFFQSFRKGGVAMNLMSAGLVLLAVIVVVLIHLVSGEGMDVLTGVMSGAVTNTPGLGAAQQTLSDVMISNGDFISGANAASSKLASAYAVAYPIGVIGVIAVLIALKAICKADIDAERKLLEEEEAASTGGARRMHCQVQNPAVFGLTLREAMKGISDKVIVSRIMHEGKISIPTADSVIAKGDKLLIVTSQQYVDNVRIVFGEEIPMHQADWVGQSRDLKVKRLTITKGEMTGKKIKDLALRSHFGVTVTRVIRAGVDLVARPDLRLQVGDSIAVVGSKEGIDQVAKIVGNKPEALSHPNLVPIFFGIALGVIVGSIPIHFPGIPQPVKLGIAGGPLIIAILLGHFGAKLRITTYTTMSANLMIREMGIAFFLAAVGLGAGQNFVSSIVDGGYWWILYGAVITIVPTFVVGLVCRYVLKFNFFQISGLIAGGTTNPPVLAFAQGAYDAEHVSVNYATVYPLSMFLRVLAAQLMILIAFA